MKYLISAAAVLFSSTSAFAMHAFATDACVGKSLSGSTVAIELSNDTPTSPHRIDVLGSVIKTNDVNQVFFVNMDQGKDSIDQPAAQAALVLKVKSTKTFASKKLDDGCFSGRASQSIRVVSVVRVEKNLNSFLDLKKGETLALSCYSDFQLPDIERCNRNEK